MIAWAMEWHERNRLDGEQRYFMWPPRLYRTRRECQAFIEAAYGYIRTRPDLRAEPHGWRMPQAVKVDFA